MSLWTGLGRLVAGKPVFQVSDQAPGEMSGSGDKANSSQPATNDSKVIPEVEIRDVDCNRASDPMSLWLNFLNTSQQAVFLDKISLFGQTRELDFEIASGETRKLEVYRGKPMSSNSLNTAELSYRVVANRDYFQARYTVEFDFDNDLYYPEEFKLLRPVRDV